MRRIVLAFLTATLLPNAAPLWAEEIGVLVTATRFESQQNLAGGVSFEVITEEEIQKKSTSQLAEILKEIPGIEVTTNGGPGSSTSLFLRGADSKNVLILVDGIPLNDPSQANRGADISAIDLSDVERIEVVRGSQSVLYGSNAQAGVINIITKQPSAESQTKYRLSLGSYSTLQASLTNRGLMGPVQYSVSLLGTQSGGFSSANPQNPEIVQGGNTAEADPWQNQKLGLKLKYPLNQEDALSLYASQDRSIKHYDDWGCGFAADRVNTSYPAPNYACTPTYETTGAKQQRSDQTQTLGRLGYQAKFLDQALELELFTSNAAQQRLYYNNDNQLTNDYQGDLKDTNLQWLYKGSIQELSLGMGQQQESMLSTTYTAGNPSVDVSKSVQTESIWLQERLFALEDRLQLILGVRQDNHSSYGQAQTYRIAPSFETEGGLKFRSSYGTGFRSPALFELFSSYGNANLQPEKSITKEVGVEQKGKSLQWGMNLFESQYQNRIEYDFNTWAYNNLPGFSQMQGVETKIKAKLGESYQLLWNHTYLETKDNQGNPLVRRAQNNSFLEFSGDWEFWDAALNLRTKSKRPETGFSSDQNGNNVPSLPAYAIAGLRFGYRMGEMKLFGRVDNLADTFYEEAWSYQQPGRSFELGVEGRF